MKILLFILIGLIVIPLAILAFGLVLALALGAATFYVLWFIYNILTGKV